jgi:hypothetical protein
MKKKTDAEETQAEEKVEQAFFAQKAAEAPSDAAPTDEEHIQWLKTHTT